jgi:hypothetical protein
VGAVAAGLSLSGGKIPPVVDPPRRRVTLSKTRHSSRCPSGTGGEWRLPRRPCVTDLGADGLSTRAVLMPAAPAGFAYGLLDEAEGRVEPVEGTGTGETR